MDPERTLDDPWMDPGWTLDGSAGAPEQGRLLSCLVSVSDGLVHFASFLQE